MPSSNAKSPPEAFDARFVATMRCTLATSVLLIFTLDPLAWTRFPEVTFLLLGFYLIYSVVLYMAARWRRPILPSMAEPWVDVGWALGLMACSGDSPGVFTEFSLFAVLIAAFRGGLAPGFRIALGAAILGLMVRSAFGPEDSDVDFRQALIGPASLVVLGYMTASFGGLELKLKRRLGLLHEVTTLSNPRFGVDRTLGMIVERLRAFYDADSCLLILPDRCQVEYHLRRADRHDPDRAIRGESLPAALAQLLLAWPEHHAIVYGQRLRGWQRWHPEARAQAFDLRQGTRLPADAKHSKALAALLDAGAFITVPLPLHSVTGARLYLTAGRRRAFDRSDVDFLLQVFAHTMPVLHNIQLVDQLASNAADAERQRIALDLHDGVIQPYIGLQIGLEAIRQRLACGHADVTPEIERLLDLTKDEIAQLRHMVQGLKHGTQRVDGLVPATRRFAHKFAVATGIQVDVEADSELQVNDRLAAEVFQLITEGLSNVRRHTQAATTTITVVQDNSHLTLQIINDGVEGEEFRPFTPRSINARVTALGGRVLVARQGHGHTAVTVEIPL